MGGEEIRWLGGKGYRYWEGAMMTGGTVQEGWRPGKG